MRSRLPHIGLTGWRGATLRLRETSAHTHTHTYTYTTATPLLSLPSVAQRGGMEKRGRRENARKQRLSVHVGLFFLLPLCKAQGKLARPALFTLVRAVTPSCSVSVCFCWLCSVVRLVSLLMLCFLFIVHRVCVQTGWDIFGCVHVLSLISPDFFFPFPPWFFFFLQCCFRAFTYSFVNDYNHEKRWSKSGFLPLLFVIYTCANSTEACHCALLALGHMRASLEVSREIERAEGCV